MFSFDPYSPAVDADPFSLYRLLRDEYPCYWSSEAKMWVLSRHADILVALSNWQGYSSARGYLGFGGGVDAWFGAMVARMSVRIIFEEFLRTYPQFERVQQQLPWMPSSTFRSPMKLELAIS